jgi:hypothetical protein
VAQSASVISGVPLAVAESQSGGAGAWTQRTPGWQQLNWHRTHSREHIFRRHPPVTTASEASGVGNLGKSFISRFVYSCFGLSRTWPVGPASKT